MGWTRLKTSETMGLLEEMMMAKDVMMTKYRGSMVKNAVRSSTLGTLRD